MQPKVSLILVFFLLGLAAALGLLFFLYRQIKRKRLKFSLLTLFLFPILLGFAVLAYERWDPWQRLRISSGLDESVEAVAYAPDGNTFACICRPNSTTLNAWKIRIFNATTLEAIKDIPLPHQRTCMRYSKDSAALLVFDYYNVDRVAIAGGNVENIFKLEMKSSELIADVASDGKQVLTLKSAKDGDSPIASPAHVRVLRTSDGKEVLAAHRTITTQDGNLSPDGSKFVGFDNEDLVVLDLKKDSEVLRVRGVLHPFSRNPEFSADGARVAVVTHGTSFESSCIAVRVYDLAGSLISSVDASALNAVFSPDNKRLLIHEIPPNANKHTLQLRELNRPMGTYDPIHFPELWLAIAAGAAFLWSLIRDIRTLRRPDEAKPSTAEEEETSVTESALAGKT